MFPILHQHTQEYEEKLVALQARGDTDLERVEATVKHIVQRVREEGDRAIAELTREFENRTLHSLRIDAARKRELIDKVSDEDFDALRQSAERIRDYHEHQVDKGFQYEKDGILLGQKISPLRSVGVYAPGGKARYPSSVLMAAVPAKVAGVHRVVLASPDPSPEVVAAAEIAGVSEIIDCGGAQAVAALAYGTESLVPVDKIVGPGNLYVACAKRLVFGRVSIDSIAGPSEILVIADNDAHPSVIAADLLSQAEHDEAAYPLLIVLSQGKAKAVSAEARAQVGRLSRKDIAEVSLRNNGVCFVVDDLREAVRIANIVAPEHLSLLVSDPKSLLPELHAAGAIFMGYHTPEAAGDYVAGPSHVLPTGGAARFSSPLGVYDFVVRTSLVQYSETALKAQGRLIEKLAGLEGLEGHGKAVSVRTERDETQH